MISNTLVLAWTALSLQLTRLMPLLEWGLQAYFKGNNILLSWDETFIVMKALVYLQSKWSGLGSPHWMQNKSGLLVTNVRQGRGAPTHWEGCPLVVHMHQKCQNWESGPSVTMEADGGRVGRNVLEEATKEENCGGLIFPSPLPLLTILQ